jgi:two-component system chemotaxis response regulator CheB
VPSPSRKRRSTRAKCDLIAIGASAGGLPALMKIVSNLEPGGPAILIVQHLDPRHKSQIPQLLARRTAVHVKEAEDGEPISRGTIYVGPADEHLLVSGGRIQLAHSRLIRFSRPSIDVMFASVAATYGDRAAGVILSGSNRDGADGDRGHQTGRGRDLCPEPGKRRVPRDAAGRNRYGLR